MAQFVKVVETKTGDPRGRLARLISMQWESQKN